MSRTRPTTAQRVLVLLDEHRTHAPGRKSLYTDDLAERLPAAEAAELAEALVELRKLQLIEELWTARITTAPRPLNYGPWRLALGTERHVDRARKVAAAFDAVVVPPPPPPPEPEMKTSPPTDAPTPALEDPANGPARTYTMDGCDLWERKYTRPAMLSLLASLGGPVRLDHLVDWMIEARSDREADELRTVLRAGARGAAQAGLVTIERDEDDRNVVTLTAKGRAALEAVRGSKLPGSLLHIEDIMSHRVYDGQALYPETPELPSPPLPFDLEAVAAELNAKAASEVHAEVEAATELGPDCAEALAQLSAVTSRVVGGMAWASTRKLIESTTEALDATLASEAAGREHIRRLEQSQDQLGSQLKEAVAVLDSLDLVLVRVGCPRDYPVVPCEDTTPPWLVTARGLVARLERLNLNLVQTMDRAMAGVEAKLVVEALDQLLRQIGFPREVDVPDADSPDPAPVRTSLSMPSRVEWLHRELVSAKARADAGTGALKDVERCHVTLSEAGLALNTPDGGVHGRVLELVRQRNTERTRVAYLEAALAKTPITPAAPAEGGDPGAQSVIEAASKLLDEADVPATNEVTNPDTGETLTVHFGLYDRIQMLAMERDQERVDAQRQGRLRAEEERSANNIRGANAILEREVAELRNLLATVDTANIRAQLEAAADEARTWTLDRLNDFLNKRLDAGVRLLDLEQVKIESAKRATYDAFNHALAAVATARRMRLPSHLGGPSAGTPEPTHGEGA